MEQVSYDNVTSLFYCVVVVFPILVVLEFLLYWLYQNKVIHNLQCQLIINNFQFHPWVEILNDDVVEDYDVEVNDEVPDNDQDPDYHKTPYIGHDSDNDQIPYIDQDLEDTDPVRGQGAPTHEDQGVQS